MAKLKIKTGDLVRVIAGKGRVNKTEGKVLKVLTKDNKVIVEGYNKVSKHTKPTAQNPQGGIIEKEAPVHISNVALVDPKTKQTTKVGYKTEGDKKVRFSKKSNQVL
ncbi:MAG: 50S ribosomal protein L24 [Bacteroidota bacterium]|nr:50S ribosomal protein L24 [Bacteroidota bacterium]